MLSLFVQFQNCRQPEHDIFFSQMDNVAIDVSWNHLLQNFMFCLTQLLFVNDEC